MNKDINFIDREDLLMKLSEYEGKDYDKDINSNVTPWGQLKLLFADLEFLNTFYDPIKYDRQIYVLYINPDSGNYIGILSDLFPKLKFLLYNTNFHRDVVSKRKVIISAKVEAAIKEERIRLYDDFTDNDLQHYVGRNDIFLISNIFSNIQEVNPDPDKLSALRVDANLRDLEYQKKLYNVIKPLHASLRFRLPTNFEDAPTSFTYMYGYLFKMPFVSLRSTETRLVPIENQLKDYDMKSYYRKMIEFNTLTRNVSRFTNPFTGDRSDILQDELITDWDTMAYLQVMSDYLKRFSGELVTKENLIKLHKYFMSSLHLRPNESYSIVGRREVERSKRQRK